MNIAARPAKFNDVGGKWFCGERPAIRRPEFQPAPRLTFSRVACGEGRTGTCQISSAYSRMVRSDENHAMRATLRMLARVQAGITCQRASMLRCASKYASKSAATM